MVCFPIFKKRWVGKHKLAAGIGKHLNGLSCCDDLFVGAVNDIPKYHFGGRTVDKGCFHRCPIAVTKWRLIFTRTFDHRSQEAIALYVSVGNTESLTECFPSVLEIGDVMPVPNNAQWVCLIKPYAEASSMLK